MLGMGGVYDEENASRYVGMGARFVLTGSDHSYIVMGARCTERFLPWSAAYGGGVGQEGQAGEGLRRTSWQSYITSRSGSCSQGEIALGFGLHHLRSSAAPMLAGAARHDYLFMDMEHGAFSVQEATQICIASLAAGIAPMVRVCAGALDEATRLLDNGALGHRRAACGHQEAGAADSGCVPLSANGAPELGRATADLQLYGPARVGGAEGDQRRSPDGGDDREPGGGKECRRHSLGGWRSMCC